MNTTKKIHPKIKYSEHIVSYNTNKNGNLNKTIDLRKKLKNNKFIIKGIINGEPIKISKKVRFPIDLLSPNKGMITSKKNSFIPKSILKKTKKKYSKLLI
jgi:hypothetical protein